MKTRMIPCLVAVSLCLLGLLSSPLSAQQKADKEAYRQAVAKLIEVSNQCDTEKMTDQLKNMMRLNKASLSEAEWNVFTEKWKHRLQQRLLKKCLPIYQKHFSLNEINQLIAFHQSPLGKKTQLAQTEMATQVILPLVMESQREMMKDLGLHRKPLSYDVKEERRAVVTRVLSESEKRDVQLMKQAFVLNPDSIKVLHGKEHRCSDSTTPLLLSVEVREKDTRATFAQPVYWDSQWFYYSPGFTLVDQESGDKYPVIGYDGGVPMGRLLTLKGMKGKYFYIHLIFPKLKKNVRRVDVLELPHEQDQHTLPSNDDKRAKNYYHIKVDRD